ncbi:esterase/lipase family protein [Cerasicoccus arenae]|uniref:Acetyltransferase n=1 Tax=Cerasicoccus arenae TaxID=424488 RepID=A0A8J3DGY1_9BACT|nr:alpha/beta hydrolase [Cerasicoccus arenae]MBK1857668.1 hypothetical protein [Cerasicoccus arenae]GHB91489.1 acetyltransferase [Cerasicoccus arenae]
MWSVSKTKINEYGQPGGETIILLDGIGPKFRHLGLMINMLQKPGRRVLLIDYPSTRNTIESLVEEELVPAIASAKIEREQPLHFVTFSMGGLMARTYLKDHAPANLGRVVHIAPPNHGSEVADWLKKIPLFRWGFGKSGQQLTTDSTSLPNTLGPACYEAGVIAGCRSLDPWFGWMFKGPNDGKVSVESARLDGMTDFAIVPSSHYLIMNHPQTLALTDRFLQEGNFGKTRQTKGYAAPTAMVNHTHSPNT